MCVASVIETRVQLRASAADQTGPMIFPKQLLLATSFPLAHPTPPSRLILKLKHHLPSDAPRVLT